MTSEHAVQTACADFLVQMGFLVIRVNSGAMRQAGKDGARYVAFVRWLAGGVSGWQTSGVSDLLAVAPGGQLWAIEVKAAGKLHHVSQAQLFFHDVVRATGGVALVVEDVSALAEAVAASRKAG